MKYSKLPSAPYYLRYGQSRGDTRAHLTKKEIQTIIELNPVTESQGATPLVINNATVN